jgi:hypothetical protein
MSEDIRKMIDKVKNFKQSLNEEKLKCMTLYHSTTQPISGQFRIKGNAGYGVYFAKSIKDSKTFGDITYKVKICPQNTLIFNDNEVKGKGFFNMSKEFYDKYISEGYDSLLWYRNGRFQEFIALKPEIIIDYEVMY